MIRLVIVAGAQTQKLAEHLEKSGAFSVTSAFNSLVRNQSVLKSSIIRADKMLFVFNENDLNIKEEMSVLQDIMVNGSFFSIKEILFVQKENAQSEKAQLYFETVMNEVNNVYRKQNRLLDSITASAETVKDALTFQKISALLLGVSKDANFDNTISKMYRCEKGNTDKIAYVPKDTRNYKVEPFSFLNLQEYNKNIENQSKLDNGIPFEDISKDRLELDNPYFGEIRISNLNRRKTVIMVTGADKSGKSVWTSALSKSLSAIKECVLILDFTKVHNLKAFLEINSVNFSMITAQELLLCKKPVSNIVLYENVFNKKDISLDFLQIFLTDLIEKSLYSTVFIVANEGWLTDLLESTDIQLSGILYCLNAGYEDAVAAKNELCEIAAKKQLKVILNSFYEVKNKDELTSIKTVFADTKLKIVAPVKFKNLNIDSQLAKILLEDFYG